MTSLMFVLMLQFVVSTKAGLVNYVQGTANVKATQSVPMGVPIKTGPAGFAEILLNPGSYLRLGENSEAVLDGIELVDVSVRVLSGTAVIEAVGFEKDTPLKVTTGNLTTKIIDDGIYSVADGKVTIVTGKLQVAGQKEVYKKRWQVSEAGAVKTGPADLMPVEIWSRNRSKLIATANVSMADSLRRTTGLGNGSSFNDVWLWVPSFGAFTYMPGYRFHSPYGYSYRSVVDTYYGSGAGSANGAADASHSGLGAGGGNSAGSSGAVSSGGGGGGGIVRGGGLGNGGGASPAPVSRPTAGPSGTRSGAQP